MCRERHAGLWVMYTNRRRDKHRASAGASNHCHDGFCSWEPGLAWLSQRPLVLAWPEGLPYSCRLGHAAVLCAVVSISVRLVRSSAAGRLSHNKGSVDRRGAVMACGAARRGTCRGVIRAVFGTQLLLVEPSLSNFHCGAERQRHTA